MSDRTTTATTLGRDAAATSDGDATPTVPEVADPAFRTVVAAVRAALTDEPPNIDGTAPDWELVRKIAARHQIVSLVYEGLSEADVPASAVEPLREEVRQNTKRNLQSTRELVRVLDSFETEGVRAIPFKGPVLAAEAYGDLNRRTFLDLDVLVHPDDALDAGHILRAHGYDADEEFGLLRRFGLNSPLLADVSECSFHHPERGEVELRWQHGHWANPLEAAFEDWWRRREVTTLAGHDVPILSPEDRILTLVTHANKHAWRRLAWLADVTATLQAADVDWDELERRATSWGVTRALHVGVALGSSLSEGVAETVPADVRRRASRDRLAALLADRVTSRLAENPLGTTSRPEELAYDFAGTGSVGKVPRSTGRVAAASLRYLLRFTSARVP